VTTILFSIVVGLLIGTILQNGFGNISLSSAATSFCIFIGGLVVILEKKLEEIKKKL